MSGRKDKAVKKYVELKIFYVQQVPKTVFWKGRKRAGDPARGVNKSVKLTTLKLV